MSSISEAIGWSTLLYPDKRPLKRSANLCIKFLHVQVDKQPRRDSNHVAHLYFVVFVLFGSFFVLNLFVGVIIDNFNRLKKDYESGGVGLFLTESQKTWYDTLKKAASKKPKKVAKRPKVYTRTRLIEHIGGVFCPWQLREMTVE